MACGNNLKQLALALHNYESRFGGLPPAFTSSPDGKRLHSWRALILPYLEEESTYEDIDFSKPWDDPANAQAYANCPQIFRCPSHELPEGFSNYLAVVGPDKCFHPRESRAFAEITDGLSSTLMIVEVSPEQAVHWMSPYDAEDSIASIIRAQSAAPHNGGRNSASADGSVRFLSDQISHEILDALETIAADDGDWERFD